MIKSYSELITFKTFNERFEYLKLNSRIGEETFGYDRHVNQLFYRSAEWLKLRDKIIIRDDGCDLGIPEYEIHGMIIVHHINPITLEDLEDQTPRALSPENLICTTFYTHNAIHFGDSSKLEPMFIERKSKDTSPWL